MQFRKQDGLKLRYAVWGLQGWENVAQRDLRKTSGDDFRTKLRDFGQPYTQQAV